MTTASTSIFKKINKKKTMVYFYLYYWLIWEVSAILVSLMISDYSFADQLSNIKQTGVVRVATFDANPPFGFIDAHTHQIVGYDVDIAYAIARELGVKLQLVPTNPANRIPLLKSGKVDLIIADITITPDRAKMIDFSQPYFITGQQFLVPISSPDRLDAFASARIGAVKGTTGEQAINRRFPAAHVLSYDDIPLAFSALRNGNVKAITQDSTILIGLINNAPDKDQYKILPEFLSKEEIGIGLNKGESALVKTINQVLIALEHSGEAKRMYDTWFNVQTSYLLTNVPNNNIH